MTVLNYTIVTCLLTFSVSEAARILAVFPVPSISHQVVFRPLTQELVKRGHEVVIITPDPAFEPDKAPANLTEIDVHDISYKIWSETLLARSKGDKDSFTASMELMIRAIISAFDAQLKDAKVKQLLADKNQKFDLILAEACVKLALVYSHLYKAPVIQVSSLSGVFDNYQTVGAPMHPFLYPAITRQRLNNLTLWEKISELYKEYQLETVFENMKQLENNLLRNHFGNNAPLINELNNEVEMLFLNINPIFEGIRPVPPTVVYMGGLHQKPIKELPSDLKSYLDSSEHGVIYISFGTNVDPSLLPPEKIQSFVNAFSTLPYDVLWKWNKDELPGRTSNIRISKWLPQSDLLRHPKIKLFITQGGLQSTDEAITAGVPLIGIPMLGDQWFNVERYEYHKIGIRLDMETLTQDKLVKTINTVISDESYRHNIVQLRKYMRDEPMRPLDRAVWWTEYVLRHGGAKPLRSPAANISWADFLELDLVLLILTILFLAAALVIVALYNVYKFAIKNYVTVKIKRA